MTKGAFTLPQDIPLDQYPRPEVFLEEARDLTDAGAAVGMVLRVLGPVALHVHFPKHVDLYRRMERLPDRVFTDLDFAAYSDARARMSGFMTSHGYETELEMMMMFGKDRHLYYGGTVPIVTVHFDRLDIDHKVDVRGRLEIHPYAVSPTDLLLQRLQARAVADEDLKDVILMLVAAPIGDGEGEMINATYVARLLADDWSFCTTATANLRRVRDAVELVPALTRMDRATAVAKADQLVFRIEAEPKSKAWRTHAERAGRARGRAQGGDAGQ